MERLQAGDMRALAEIYDRHSGILYSVALRIVRRLPDAEEVLQDTWIHAWRRAASYDPSRGTVAAWLVAVARSRAIDSYRSAASRLRAETVVEPDPPVEVDEPVAHAARLQLHERVVSALATLSPQQRQVLELAYFGGLSQSEVSARLGAPLGTVKSWARQGLRRLRELVPGEDRT